MKQQKTEEYVRNGHIRLKRKERKGKQYRTVFLIANKKPKPSWH